MDNEDTAKRLPDNHDRLFPGKDLPLLLHLELQNRLEEAITWKALGDLEKQNHNLKEAHEYYEKALAHYKENSYQIENFKKRQLSENFHSDEVDIISRYKLVTNISELKGRSRSLRILSLMVLLLTIIHAFFPTYTLLAASSSLKIGWPASTMLFYEVYVLTLVILAIFLHRGGSRQGKKQYQSISDGLEYYASRLHTKDSNSLLLESESSKQKYSLADVQSILREYLESNSLLLLPEGYGAAVYFVANLLMVVLNVYFVFQR
ncbi:tetratricopeptide repeat protein [Gloeobacter violaceus]|nr:tetratricopeptide repeat protein [Gloeobacter violaceus]